VCYWHRAGVIYPEFCIVNELPEVLWGSLGINSKQLPHYRTVNSEKRLASLADRLEAQYSAAIACADGKLGVDILKTLSRVEAERHHRIVDRRQQEADDLDSEKQMWPTSKMADNVLAKVCAAYEKMIAFGMTWCPLCSARPVNPQTVQEFIRSHANVHDSAAN
jgi:hypothetical protein